MALLEYKAVEKKVAREPLATLSSSSFITLNSVAIEQIPTKFTKAKLYFETDAKCIRIKLHVDDADSAKYLGFTRKLNNRANKFVASSAVIGALGYQSQFGIQIDKGVKLKCPARYDETTRMLTVDLRQAISAGCISVEEA